MRSKQRLEFFLLGFVLCAVAQLSVADPEADRQAFRQTYEQRFPNVKIDDFVLGVYAIDPKLRVQYEAINEFPPYEFALDEGQILASAPFPNGTTLSICLTSNGDREVNEYPYFDVKTGEIITLPVAINQCRERNGTEPLSYRRQTLSKILAHLYFGARDSRRAVELPSHPGALAAYESGRKNFYAKRGQLNLSCADCHMSAVGKHLREQTLTPLLGVVNHYPVYGLSWGALGTLHQRFVGCMEQVRAAPSDPQSQEFRELEYFLAIMSNGLPMTGPGIHR